MHFESLASPAELRAHAQSELQKYFQHFPAEAIGLQAIAGQLADTSVDPFSRANMQGHITTSGVVYDATADKVLLIHHRTLNRWLQPGGHHEGLDRLDVSAAREVEEETGVSVRLSKAASAVIDTTATLIPDIDQPKARARMSPGDASAALTPQWAEVRGVRWVAREALWALQSARFARLVGKLLHTL
ncbi:NUDIX domain-containing protein [Rhodoferax sp.]|uniref:NUDIX domain-containing protein n=1 Tax=Rhodoferax sp. TaxID=50421 RepID=UPI002ACECECE|nr:NUDIX domain-containing protein [Rhodoferax sp.]MDZ7922435.1 NUDIX domain-containing protein [Rhodoferax sp.]